MLWIVLCVCVSVSVAHELRCEDPRCVYQSEDWGWQQYTVDGHNISFRYKNEDNEYTIERLYINCFGNQVLGSIAMPRFTSELQASFVKLNNCPLPESMWLISALGAINVSFEPDNNDLELILYNLPNEPALTSRHLHGLHKLTWLAIHSSIVPEPEPTPGFLSYQPNLRALFFSGVKYTPEELTSLSRSVEVFHRSDDNTKTLSQILSEIKQALPGVRDLTLEHRPHSDGYNNLWDFDFEERTRLDASLSPSLERLRLLGWKKSKLEPLQQCDGLRSLQLDEPHVDKLPDRWVAACPRLENLTLDDARSLRRLPAKLLEGAVALKSFKLDSNVRNLPRGFLQGAPNLIELEIERTSIETLSIESVAGPKLQVLSLGWNSLNNNALDAISSQTSLTTLELNSNYFTGNLCTDEDYAGLRNLPKLKTLNIEYNNVHVCSDWQQYFPHLENLKHNRY